jgi:hypothetical protein
LQERHYSFLPFLARHGMRVMEEILAELHPLEPVHEVLAL